MSKKKFIRIGTSLAALALVTIVSGRPVLASETNSPKTSMSQPSNGTTNTKRLIRLASALRRQIDNAITNLTRREDNLKTRIAHQLSKGKDVTKANDAVADLGSQITTLKGITVPTNPTNVDELKDPRANYKTARKAALADISTANKALAQNLKK